MASFIPLTKCTIKTTHSNSIQIITGHWFQFITLQGQDEIKPAIVYEHLCSLMPKKTKVVWITWSYQQRLRHRGIYSTSIETQQQEEIWLWSLFVFFFNLFLEAENNTNFKVWTKFDMVRLPGKTCLSNLLMTSNTWKTSRCVSVCVKHGLKPSENVQDECELTK